MSMESFPVELLCEIFSWIPREHGFAVRLVCKTFEAAANRFVFSELHLSYLPLSFYRMNEISKSPKLSQHVKTVLYDGSVLLEYDTRARNYSHSTQQVHWEVNLRMPYSHQLSKVKSRTNGRYTDQEIANGWEYYKKLGGLIQTFSDSHRDYTILASSFARFSNLMDVRVLTNDDMDYDYMDWYQQFESFESLVFKLALVKPGFNMISDRPQVGLVPYGRQQVLSIMSAIQSSSLKLSNLHLSLFFWPLLDGPYMQQYAHDIFVHLKSLHLRICDYPNEGSITFLDKKDRRRCLGTLLARAEQLEDLCLSFDRWDWDAREMEESLDLSQIFGKTTWKRLKHLELRYMDLVDELYLPDFLSRHSETLCSLALGEICSFSTSWRAFFIQIKSNLSTSCTFSLKGSSLELYDEETDEHQYLYLDEVHSTSDDHDATPLKERLENWVMGKGEFPLEEA